jgi:hypothetical protein
MKGFLISFAVTLIVVVLVLLFWPAPAYSQTSPLCGYGDAILKPLMDKYDEKIAVTAISGRMLVQIYVSEKGTCTVVLLNPSGMACMVLACTDWQAEPVVVRGKPS